MLVVVMPMPSLDQARFLFLFFLSLLHWVASTTLGPLHVFVTVSVNSTPLVAVLFLLSTDWCPQVATYNGGIPGSFHGYTLDASHHFSKGKPMLVCLSHISLSLSLSLSIQPHTTTPHPQDCACWGVGYLQLPLSTHTKGSHQRGMEGRFQGFGLQFPFGGFVFTVFLWRVSFCGLPLGVFVLRFPFACFRFLVSLWRREGRGGRKGREGESEGARPGAVYLDQLGTDTCDYAPLASPTLTSRRPQTPRLAAP